VKTGHFTSTSAEAQSQGAVLVLVGTCDGWTPRSELFSACGERERGTGADDSSNGYGRGVLRYLGHGLCRCGQVSGPAVLGRQHVEGEYDG